MLDRFDVRNAQAVRHQTTADAAASRSDGDAVLLGVVDEVPHREEVVDVPHPLDHAEFPLEALLDPLRERPAEASRHALVAEAFEMRRLVRHPVDPERGRVRHAQVQLQVAHVGHERRVLKGARVVREHALHLVGVFEIDLVALELHAVGSGQELARVDAHQRVLGNGVGRLQVVGVVRADHERADLFGDLQEPRRHTLLLLHPVVDHLDEEVLLAEDILILARHAERLIVVVPQKEAVDLASQTRRRADQSRAVLREQLLVHAGAVVEPFEIRLAGEFDEVAVALKVLGQKEQVIGGFPRAVALAVEAAIGRHVHLAADDGLDAGRLGLAVELERAEEIAVVGDRDGAHPAVFRALDEVVDP